MSKFTADLAADVHLLAIRKALSNRNAAVMVGAGFSRNADGGENLATWRQLSDALKAELQPGVKSDAFSPSETSTLAEQYSRAFSPIHLENLIKKCVPDDQITPGFLHSALLELQWADVFTTNYDTLLERAADKLLEVSYFTVNSREDIPQSKTLNRRRIVKLHGSFPSQRPFIFTEEHYRTYPEKFAPFVNLVRQSLLENVFCLIGFSGDDPNFLHWIGWVRDMLDKHTLPIYLFLADEPTLGESKLYEARGVIPVTLPIAADGDRRNYRGRYKQLFSELARPLSDSPLDWGEFPPPPSNQGIDDTKPDDEYLNELLPHLKAMFQYRQSYPGWLLAPHPVRLRMNASTQWFRSRIEQNRLRQVLQRSPPHVALAVLELYFWIQGTLLAPLDDAVSLIALDCVEKSKTETNSEPLSGLIQIKEKFWINDPEEFRRIWTAAALGLTTWARQSHRISEYNSLREQIRKEAPADSAVQDRLTYEELLLRLQSADKPAARRILSQWRPKSTDGYTQVLKASLLAEVGDRTASMLIFEQAIRVLRRQQRSRPNDPALISREAWACLLADLVQRATDFSRLIQTSEENKDQREESDIKENFDGRIDTLGTRGYSARAELTTALAAMNTEVALPVAERQDVVHFDLGYYSTNTRHGPPSILAKKISASFAWLELIERVGLIPHTKHGTFYAKEMLQAAWWARFADTPARAVGLLLRAHQKDSLAPRDHSLPFHHTGWLSRYEVARLSAPFATSLAGELLRITVADLESRSGTLEDGGAIAFNIEAFSRLAIRVQDTSTLRDWSHSLLQLFSNVSFQSSRLTWQPTGVALRRLLEALAPEEQAEFFYLACGAPLAPPDGLMEHHINEWLDFFELLKSVTRKLPRNARLDWSSAFNDLLNNCKNAQRSDISRVAWRRLEVLRNVGLLKSEEQLVVSKLLWKDDATKNWPSIPGLSPACTLSWPIPASGARADFVNRVLAPPFRPFSGGYMQLTLRDGKRSYGIGGADQVLSHLNFALRQKAPSQTQLAKLVANIENWVDEERADLSVDMTNSSEVYIELRKISEHLDDILSHCVAVLAAMKKPNAEKLLVRLGKLEGNMSWLPSPLLKLNVALINSGRKATSSFEDAVREMVRLFSATSSKSPVSIAELAAIFLSSSSRRNQTSSALVFEAAVACVYSRRMPGLQNGLETLGRLTSEAWAIFLTEKSRLLLDIALVELHEELSYDLPIRQNGLKDESIPLLRYETARLAFVLTSAGIRCAGAARWVESASTDPLPELRNGKFKLGT